MKFLHYPIAVLGSLGALVAAFLIVAIGRRIIDSRGLELKERYRWRQVLTTATIVCTIVLIVILWARLLEQKGTFLGILGAGLAVALKEPLLAIAGRIAILAGHIYTVGDRIEINKIKGDVIDVGFFYTRMMEIGNWIGGDQASGRIVQFSNSKLFGSDPVFNYTRTFSYIWDELKLPITYASNIKETADTLVAVGGDYTKEFLKGAQKELQEMERYFLVPEFELEPQIYIAVTSNWVELTMRYVVDPKKRRAAQTFIYTRVFERLQGRKDVTIASETMDLTIHQGPGSESSSQEARQNRSQIDVPGGSQEAA